MNNNFFNFQLTPLKCFSLEFVAACFIPKALINICGKIKFMNGMFDTHQVELLIGFQISIYGN